MGHVTIINCFIFLEKQLKMGRRDDIRSLSNYNCANAPCRNLCPEWLTKMSSLEVIM